MSKDDLRRWIAYQKETLAKDKAERKQDLQNVKGCFGAEQYYRGTISGLWNAEYMLKDLELYLEEKEMEEAAS